MRDVPSSEARLIELAEAWKQRALEAEERERATLREVTEWLQGHLAAGAPRAAGRASCALPSSTRPRIYIAGSSSELPRVRRAMEAACGAGLEVTHDWAAEVERVGQANPADATRAQRSGWARDCLDGIACASAVWLLVPEEPTRGAWVELGFAIALAGRRAAALPVVASGRTSQSIFCSLVQEVATDEQALAVLRGWLL